MEGGGSDNLTKVVMGALKKHGSVFHANAIRTFMFFKTNGVNVFQRVRNGVIHQIFKIGMCFIWKAYIAWHIALT
jgi:hypothetical protein